MRTNVAQLDILIDQIRAGDPHAFGKLWGLVKIRATKIANSYYIPNGDYHDVINETMMAVYSAVLTYAPTHDCSFLNFCYSICIPRKLNTYVLANRRLRHMPLTDSMRFEATKTVSPSHANYEGDEEEASLPCPADHYLALVERADIDARLNALRPHLTEIEEEVLDCIVQIGASDFAEVVARLGHNVKWVDNCMTRVRKKLAHVKRNDMGDWEWNQ